MARLVTGGGSDLSPDMQKIVAKLEQLLKGGKKLNIGIDELKRKAGVFNVKNETVSAYIRRKKKDGLFKNLTIKKFAGGLEAGVSKYDSDYNNSKKFRNFYNQTYDTSWNKASAINKINAYNAFLRNEELVKGAKGFTLTTEEMAKKLGLPLETLRKYESKPDANTSSQFIKDNIEKKRTVGVNPTTGRRETVVRYKDPGVNVLKNWNALISSPKISSAMVDNIKEYDKVFRKKLKDNKGKLPDIGEVIQKTSMKTPTTIANTEALYSRLLRGETFRTDVDIAKDAVLGKKIINELGINSTNNARRSAFYNLALDNINKMYPNESGNLETFKTRFRNELKNVLGLKKGQVVPFSVNEVIGLSTGETRGIQPFSVFVDAVETNINKNELKNYQGAFSAKVKKIQDLLSGNKPNVAEAKKIALSLDSNRNTLVDRLTKKGFTKAQINQLNLPDIKVGSNVLETYKAKDLSRFKKAGLDIAQFAKDKGFYIDVKKAKPFWESNVQNTLVELAKNNTGNVCNIFKGKIAFSADGGRIGFSGGCATEMADALQKNTKETLQSINKTDGIIPKAKNAATKFLIALKENPNLLRGSLGSKIALGLGTVAAGAGAGALVKQFRNDDPSTYLTNDSQMEGMIIADVEQKGKEVDDNILLDNQFKLELAGAAGLTTPIAKKVYQTARGVGETGPLPEGVGRTRAALGLEKGVLGKGLWALGAPIIQVPSTLGYIAQDVREGKDVGEIATNPLNYLGAAFMNPAVKALGKAGMSRGLLGIASLGLAGTAALPALSIGAGLATLGTLGYQGYKLFTGKNRSDEDFFR
tara:strand:- start:682 stop:3126 length:2445 start_codon:yes stop_codon:yes gene_type:complete